MQIDVGSIYKLGGPASIRVQSVTLGEAYDVWGSNTLGDKGSAKLISGSTVDNDWVSLPSWGTYQYYSVSVTTGHNAADNVLFDAIQAGVPEPGTVALFGCGIVALMALRRRRSAS